MTVALAYEKEVRPKQQFVDINWVPDGLGPGVHAVMGLTQDGAELLQSIQFGADYFSKESALEWLSRRK